MARIVDVPTPASVAIGTPISVEALREMAWQLGGTFVATVQLEGSINNVDWVIIGSALSAKGLTQIAGSYAFVRANTTAYTSGAPTVKLLGHERA